jgi:hypothetical protein
MPEVELVGTLAIGNVTEALQEFFVESLTSVVINIFQGPGTEINLTITYSILEIGKHIPLMDIKTL